MINYAFEVGETARLIKREANRRAALLGATKAQWRVLVRLHRAGGGLRQVELAELLDIEPITLCRIIDRLAESGLVKRQRDAEDRRAWRLHLTEAATPIIAQLEQMGLRFNAELLDGIPEKDRAIVLRALETMRGNLDRMGELEQAS
jgi:DNA-binding MarR family transcriptional regulator